MPKIISLDLETTGLDPLNDQILAIAAVMDDYTPGEPQVPLGSLPMFHRIIARDRVSGHPAAMAMNADLLRKIGEGEGVELHTAIYDLRDWALDHGHPRNANGYLDNAVIAGKNVWKLDLMMLLHAKDRYSDHSRGCGRDFVEKDCHHRVIDPTTLYHNPYPDKAPPSMRECLKRAGLESAPFALTEHDPVDDCLKVLALLRHKWSTHA